MQFSMEPATTTSGQAQDSVYQPCEGTDAAVHAATATLHMTCSWPQVTHTFQIQEPRAAGNQEQIAQDITKQKCCTIPSSANKDST